METPLNPTSHQIGGPSHAKWHSSRIDPSRELISISERTKAAAHRYLEDDNLSLPLQPAAVNFRLSQNRVTRQSNKDKPTMGAHQEGVKLLVQAPQAPKA